MTAESRRIARLLLELGFEAAALPAYAEGLWRWAEARVDDQVLECQQVLRSLTRSGLERLRSKAAEVGFHAALYDVDQLNRCARDLYQVATETGNDDVRSGADRVSTLARTLVDLPIEQIPSGFDDACDRLRSALRQLAKVLPEHCDNLRKFRRELDSTAQKFADAWGTACHRQWVINREISEYPERITLMESSPGAREGWRLLDHPLTTLERSLPRCGYRRALQAGCRLGSASVPSSFVAEEDGADFYEQRVVAAVREAIRRLSLDFPQIHDAEIVSLPAFAVGSYRYDLLAGRVYDNIRERLTAAPLSTQPDSTVTLTVAELTPPEYQFSLKGDVFMIRGFGEENLVKSRKGLVYIHKILSSPSHRVGLFELVAGAGGDTRQLQPLTRHDINDPEARAAIRTSRAELLDAVERARRDGSPELPTLETELAELEEHAIRASTHTGDSRSFSDPLDKARSSVSQAVLRARRVLERLGMIETAAHFKTCIRVEEGELIYTPAPASLEWVVSGQ